MLKTGTVPVADQLNRLPVAANGERKSIPSLSLSLSLPFSLPFTNNKLTSIFTTVGKGKAKQTEEEDDEEAELEKLRAEMAMS